MKEIQKLIEIEKMKAQQTTIDYMLRRFGDTISKEVQNEIRDMAERIEQDIEKKRKLVNV